MNKDASPNKKITFNGKSNLTKLQIHRLITVEDFLKRVKKDPNSIFEDFDVKYAIERLQEWCLSDNRIRKESGKRILKKAGLTAYVPKSPRGNLKKYVKHPTRLFQEVDILVERLGIDVGKESLPKRGRNEKGLKTIIKQILNGQIKEEVIETEFERGTPFDLRSIAIFIIALKNHIVPKTLYQFYYKKRSELKKKTKKAMVSFRMPIRENIELLEDTESPFYNYNRAYEKYVMNKHILTEDIKKTLKQLALNLQPFLNKLAELGKSLEKSFQPVKQILSNIKLTQSKPLKTE